MSSMTVLSPALFSIQKENCLRRKNTECTNYSLEAITIQKAVYRFSLSEEPLGLPPLIQVRVSDDAIGLNQSLAWLGQNQMFSCPSWLTGTHIPTSHRALVVCLQKMPQKQTALKQSTVRMSMVVPAVSSGSISSHWYWQKFTGQKKSWTCRLER